MLVLTEFLKHFIGFRGPETYGYIKACAGRDASPKNSAYEISVVNAFVTWQRGIQMSA